MDVLAHVIDTKRGVGAVTLNAMFVSVNGDAICHLRIVEV
jgi:hypothetical protein